MVATALTRRTGRPWNPLRCDGTSLPAGWLLSAKLLAFTIVRSQRFLDAGAPFLPFFSWLDSPWFGTWLAVATATACYAAFISLLFNHLVRAACVVMAGCVLVHVAAHRLVYANNLLFACVLLLIIGLYEARMGLWPLRAQLAIVYAGASLNKIFDPDWWNGRFFDTLMRQALHIGWYDAAVARWPSVPIAAVLSVGAMATEAAIAVAILVTRDGRRGVVLMVLFHVAMLAASRGQLSLPFTYASVAIAAAFVFPLTTVTIRWAEPALWWTACLAIRAIPSMLRLM